eukprot:GHRR01033416.1.p2 GENE.GHRR01033416.1~~GHRR01033416.1.p2  ORF type:complete len:102 (-),score=16.00 GHRR01033416.1:536-841(-)
MAAIGLQHQKCCSPYEVQSLHWAALPASFAIMLVHAQVLKFSACLDYAPAHTGGICAEWHVQERMLQSTMHHILLGMLQCRYRPKQSHHSIMAGIHALLKV